MMPVGRRGVDVPIGVVHEVEPPQHRRLVLHPVREPRGDEVEDKESDDELPDDR